MNKDIVVVCDDLYGLDVYMIIEAINERAKEQGKNIYRVLGFICEDENPFGDIIPPRPLLSKITAWKVTADISYIMAIREPKKKKATVKFLRGKGAKFETIIAPWVLLPFEMEAGEGCILANYSCKNKSRFGEFVILDTVMCETVNVGSFSTLCPFSNITNSTIGEEVFVGSHSVIMEHKKVGNGARIETGSIVVTHVKPQSWVGGVPARKLNQCS